MATVTDLSGLAPTEVRGFDRQRRMAQALTDQSMKPVTGQMVGQHYVANPWGNIANVFSAYQGKQMGERVDREEEAATAAARQRNAQLMGQALRTYRGYEEDRDVNATPMDDEGNVMPAATQRVKVAGDKDRAVALLSGSTSPQAQALAGKILEQQFREPKWEKVDLPQPNGTTKVGWVDVNSPNPEATFRQGGINPGITIAERARLADEGILPGGGISPVNQGGQGAPAGPGGASGQQVTPQMSGQANVAPVQQMVNTASPNTAPPQPQYVYNPNISPKANREAAAKFFESQQKKVTASNDMLPVVKEIAGLLSTGQGSSGRADNIVTGIGEFFNIAGKDSEADARFKQLSSQLTLAAPRMEGPQGVLDLKLYEQYAGDLGNPNLPLNTRQAALKGIVDMQKKYSQNPEWHNIDTAGPVVKKQTFLRGERNVDPKQFREGLSVQDQQAFDWARQNPTDPRAKAINSRLGISR